MFQEEGPESETVGTSMARPYPGSHVSWGESQQRQQFPDGRDHDTNSGQEIPEIISETLGKADTTIHFTSVWENHQKPLMRSQLDEAVL